MNRDSHRMTKWKDCICRSVALAMLACFAIFAISMLSAAAQDVSVGSYVTFGTYPQTAEGNDNTPIEWLVLDRNGDHALLLSRDSLDVHEFYPEHVDVTWEKSTLRAWLNDDFLNRAFTAEEQAAILLTSLSNSSGQDYWQTSGCGDTQDRIFALSYAEAYRYFGIAYKDSSHQEACAAPTDYAKAKGVRSAFVSYAPDGRKNHDWWLRSPGRAQSLASVVTGAGSLDCYGVESLTTCVRPALWVDLASGVL